MSAAPAPRTRPADAQAARARFDRTVLGIRLALAVLAGCHLLSLIFDAMWAVLSIGSDDPGLAQDWIGPSWYATQVTAVVQPIVSLALAVLLLPRRGHCPSRMPSLLLFAMTLATLDGLVFGASAMLAQIPAIEATASNLYYAMLEIYHPFRTLDLLVDGLLDFMLWVTLAVVIHVRRGPRALVILYAVVIVIWYVTGDVLYPIVARGEGGEALYVVYIVLRLLAIGGYASCLLWLRDSVERLLPAPPGTCRRCRYPTRGLDAGICPECGAPIGEGGAS